jgi:hypothetical protein
MNRTRPATDALEARMAARVIGVLATTQPTLSPDTAERLRFARQQALERARAVRAAAAPLPVSAAPLAEPAMAVFGGPGFGLAAARTGSVSGLFGGPMPWWRHAAALLPLVVLVAGLVGIDHFAMQEQIHTAADIDAALLADDLPPEAYADPGFAEFLRSDPAP